MFGEEHKLFRDAVRSFFKQEVVPHQERWREEGMVDREAWTKAGFLRGQWFGNYVQAERYFKTAEALLTEGRIPRDDPRWEKIAAYRQLLREQRAEEDAEAAGGG